MKRIAFALLAMLVLGGSLLAQKAPAKPKAPAAPTPPEGRKEIIIEKKEDGKNEKTIIIIDNGKVTINGKPAQDYKGEQRIIIDDDIVINGNVVRVPGARGGVTVRKAPSRAFLGVSSEADDKGARITEVVKESAAAKAGLQAGDIITGINGKKVSGSEGLLETVRQFKPEEQVDVTFLRDGKEKKVKATLGKTDDAMAWTMPEDFMQDFGRDFNFRMEPPMAFAMPRGRGDVWMYGDSRPKYGMGVEDNPDGDGVKVSNVEPESSAAKAGLQKDDLIVEAEGKSIRTVDDLREELAKGREKSALTLKVQRGGSTQTLTLRVPKRIKSAEL
ncbi:MAG: PDZ domain-containing protein [Chitinophagaceae bacterium]|jgi:serine protease Do|nr:PDZ domain-containing protein [Chitinophagaceae bacterium]